MNSSRIKNTKRNLVLSYLSSAVTLLFDFLSRSLIVKVLGEQYLGLSSLFSSVLSVLNVAELGFSAAIVFNMFKPIAEDDTDTVCALLAYYRKIYIIVGTIILTAGVVILPFIPKMIKGTYPQGINVYFLYLLYLVNSGLSYFLFSYKGALLSALQRLDLTKVALMIARFVQYGLQLIAVFLFKNYYLYVFFAIVGTAGINVFSAIIAKKYFPQYVCKGTLSKDTKQEIAVRVKGLMICRISGVSYSAFDSIIISTYLGLTSVAIYNNYLMIFSKVSAIIALIRAAMQGSVGNSVAKESVEKNFKDMQLWQFFFSVIATLCASCLICLYQPFMALWMGKDMLLSMKDVVLLCIWFSINVVEHSYFVYLSATGMWWDLRWPYILSTVTNLLLNFILGRFYGTTGIIFASMFSSFVFCLIWQCAIILKKYFRKNPWVFFKRQLIYYTVAFFVCGITYLLCITIEAETIFGLLLRACVAGVISSCLVFLVYCKTSIFKQGKEFVFRVLSSKTE